ncbi:MAG: N-acetylmuramoyl-L-alanine amidase [Bacteroidales bacterium]|nr:N-acetylmuramoyl-L-alanine amidase [Bacteroidales bacterium]
MRKLFTLAFTLLAITVFGQVRFVEIESHYESGTSLVAYKVDAPIVQDINGGYGFTLKTPFEFTSFALGWMSSTQNYQSGQFNIVFKVHKPGMGWSDWKTDEGFTNPGDTRSGYYKSNLMFGFDENLHDSVEFYIHTPEGEVITDLYIIVQDISSTIDPKAVMQTEDNGAKACPEFPAVIPRSEWCGSYDACHNPTYSVTYRNCTHTVVHHGASPDSYTDGYAVVRSYWNYHVNSNGWSDIGYNYLFDKYGNFFQGRHNPNMPNQDVHAAHAGYANTYSIGLNFLGNSDATNTAPTTPQLQKCAEFLAWWYDYKVLDPLSSASILNQAGTEWITLPRICGHKDVNPGGTTCPGTALYALLPSIRTNTNQIIVDCTTPSDTEAPTTSVTTARDWYNSDFEVSFSDADNAGGTGVQYSFYQIMDYNGTEWRANASEGFFNDNFTTAIHSDWTQYSGTWSINSGHVLQTNETSTNTNLYAMVDQQGGDVYLYHWQQKISGSGTNKRSGMHFFCSDPTQTGRLNSYMVYLRDEGNTAEIYKYYNNSYETVNGGFFYSETYDIAPNVWYDVKVILNTNTGEISLYIDNNLAASTIDASPLSSGNSISLRTGGCQTEYDDIKVYKSRSNTTIVSAGESTDEQIRYQSLSHTQEAGRIRTLLIDNAENWSESISKNIFTDFDAPTTGINVSGTWQTADFTASFADSDALSGVEKGFYNVSDFNGTKWSSNNNRGYAFDSFDSNIGTEWTSQTGTWAVSSGTLIQSNEAESNTNLHAYLQQDLSNRYVYEFDMKIDGAGSNKRAGFHYFSDSPTLTNRGNGYFVWFRLSTQDLEFYKVTDDVFSLEKYYDISISAAQWYNIKIIYDRITGETLVYMDNTLVGEYTDSEPYSTGNYVSFRSGNAILSVDNFKTYRSRYTDVTISGGESTDDIRYSNAAPEVASAKISSMVLDSAKNISTAISQTYNVDFSVPTSIATVNDGTSSDIDNSFVTSSISGNWSASSDPNSDIVAYYYAVGTTSGGTQLLGWTNNNLSTTFTNSSVSLVPGTTYFVSVKSLNGAGLYSAVSTSDGLLIQAADCPEDIELCIDDDAITLSGATPISGTYSGTGVSAGSFNPSFAGAGTHVITYTIDISTCNYNITVNPLPTVDCPDDIYIAVDAAAISLSGASPSGGVYTIAGNPVTTFNPASYGIGSYEVIYTYTNTPENCTNTCSFTIFVFEPLVIDCPNNYEVCENSESFVLAGATPPGGTYTGIGVSSGNFDPSVAGIGTHEITYTYNTESCNFSVIVYELPEVTCPANIDVLTTDASFTLSGATPEGGTYNIGGNTVTNFNPATYGEGIYTVTYYYSGTPANCESSCSFTITVEEPLVLDCPENFSVCLDQEAFELTGASPAGGAYSGTGVISGVFDPTAAGLGTHTITYSYETENCNFEITVNQNPEVSCPEDFSITDNDSPFPLVGGNPSGGIYSINGNNLTYINPPSYEPGDYVIVYTYYDETTDCYGSCEYTMTVTPYVNLEEELLSNFEIWPNPTTGEFNIKLPQLHSECNIKMIDLQGIVIEERQVMADTELVEFNRNNLSAGVYFIQIATTDLIKVKKLVVE